MFKILAVNPGSTSTKFGCFEEERLIFEKNAPFEERAEDKTKNLFGQIEARFQAIKEALEESGISDLRFDAVVGRGGLLAPVKSGTYAVCDEMIEYLEKAPRGVHASNLGPLLARRFAELSGALACIVDPVSVDEMAPEAKISGAPEIERTSLVHALNQRAVARKVARKLGKNYEYCSFVVAHLGSGTTVGAHLGGRIVDVVGAQADGPFSAERAGGLPADGLVELCFSGKYTYEELRKKLLSGWGLLAYLGTRDIREIFKMAEKDPRARLVLEAFVYKTAKGIGEMAAALCGRLDAVVITGGMAHSAPLLDMLVPKIKFLGRIEVVPGEEELEALALGALRVLRKEERIRRYPDGEYI